MIIFKESEGLDINLTSEQLLNLSDKEEILDAIKSKSVFVFDVFENEQLIAFAMLRPYETGFFLWDYAIDYDFQNKGYGTKILKALIEKLKTEFNAECITTTYKFGNYSAKRLYEKVGFIQTDIVNENGIHEINMILQLK